MQKIGKFTESPNPFSKNKNNFPPHLVPMKFLISFNIREWKKQSQKLRKGKRTIETVTQPDTTIDAP